MDSQNTKVLQGSRAGFGTEGFWATAHSRAHSRHVDNPAALGLLKSNRQTELREQRRARDEPASPVKMPLF